MYAGTTGSASTQATATNGDGGGATAATFSSTFEAFTGDSNGILYIADTANNKVRRIAANGIISTIAGTGVFGYTTSAGVATSTTLYGAYGVWVDTTGRVWIGEQYSLKMLDTAGILSAIAAAATSLSSPYGLTGDTAGNVYIVDSSRYVIRKYSSTYSTLITIAGTEISGLVIEDGPATSTPLKTHYYGIIYNNVMYFTNWFDGAVHALTNSDPTLAPTKLPTVVPSVSPTQRQHRQAFPRQCQPSRQL